MLFSKKAADSDKLYAGCAKREPIAFDAPRDAFLHVTVTSSAFAESRRNTVTLVSGYPTSKAWLTPYMLVKMQNGCDAVDTVAYYTCEHSSSFVARKQLSLTFPDPPAILGGC